MLPGKTYSVRDVIEIARKRAMLLIIPPIVTLFGALVYSSTLPDIYQSSMLIAIVPQRVPNEFVRSTVTLSIEDRLGTITVQVMSRSVLEPIVTEFDLYPEERAQAPMEDVIGMMREHVSVDPVAPGRFSPTRMRGIAARSRKPPTTSCKSSSTRPGSGSKSRRSSARSSDGGMGTCCRRSFPRICRLARIPRCRFRHL
jgi:hypothetical protein